MTYQELIANIRDLGFSDDAEVADFQDLVPNSINRAITEINLDVAPIIERYEFDLTGTDTGYQYIIMPDVDENFLDFADVPVLFAESRPGADGKTVETPKYTRFNDYDIEANDTIVINADDLRIGDGESLSFRVFYKVAHTPYDEAQEAQKVNELPLPRKVHHLVPLLASFYIWLEDEPTKASQYYNLYEQAKSNLTVNAKPRMKVLPGGI